MHWKLKRSPEKLKIRSNSFKPLNTLVKFMKEYGIQRERWNILRRPSR